MKYFVLLHLTFGFVHSQIFTRISVNDGLSQSLVQCIMQDSQGYMWFGTKDGLNQYDGIHFRWFKHDPSDTNSLSGNSITAIMQSNDKRIWIGTESDGLNILEPATSRLVRCRASPPSKTNLSHNTVRAIVQNKTGDVWIATRNGLNRFTENGFEQFFPNPTGANSITAMMADPSGHLWIATEEGGLYEFDPQALSFKLQWIPDAGIITSLMLDASGDIWAGTHIGGLYRAGADRRFSTYKTFQNRRIIGLVKDAQGRLNIGFFDDGLAVVDRDAVIHVRHRFDDPSSLSSSNLKSIYRDRGGLLWIGTNGYGLNKLDVSRKFHMIGFDPKNRNSLSHPSVRSILASRDGETWIGTYEGIDIFDRRLEKIGHLDARNGLAGTVVFSMAQDPFRPLIWIGTDSIGLSTFDINTRQIRTHRIDTPELLQLVEQGVLSILVEESAILVGTSKGLYAVDPRTVEFSNVLVSYKNSTGGSTPPQIRSIVKEKDDLYWIGTDRGVFQMSADHKVVGHFDRLSTGLGNDDVVCLLIDSVRGLWVGTNGGGLNLLKHDLSAAKVFTEKEGLPSNVVYGILPDRQGRLWLSTNNGLARFDPDSATFQYFGIEDGLQSREFNTFAYSQGFDGTLYFGGINGVNFFDPDSLPQNTHLPDVVLTEVRIFNKPLELNPAIGWRDRIDLDHNQNLVTISFAAMDYAAPHRNQYAYQLEGVDRDWNYVGSQRSANYANLAPGTYQFRVKASNNDGLWNVSPTRLTIAVHPPFWATWWFRSGIAVILILIVRWLYRRRIASIENRKKYLERVVEERTTELRKKNEELALANHLKNEFLGIAAHDLRNPLTSIMGYADAMRDDLKQGLLREGHEDDLTQIVKSSQNMTELINDLLDISAIESGNLRLSLENMDLIPLLDACILRYRKLAQRKGILVDYKPDANTCFVQGDARRLTEVLDNLLSNAVKFSFANGTVALLTEARPDSVHVHVQDSGPGLREQDFKNLFMTFKKLSARPTGGESSTGLGLSIAKKIVEYHGGQLWATNLPARGAQFSFSLNRANQTSGARPHGTN